MTRFKKVYIEITNRCNLNCTFCSERIKGKRDMSLDQFKIVIKRVKPCTKHIYLHVLGEPTIHPQLLQFIDVAENENIAVNLTTNGLLLKKYETEILNKKGLRQINISIHSKGGYKSDKEQDGYVKKMAEFALNASENSRVIVSLRLWNQGVEKEKNFNEKVVIMLKRFFISSDEFTADNSDRRGFKLAHNVYLNFEERFVWPKIDSLPKNSEGFCLGLRDQIAILSDGTVVPCCLDANGEINLGNIFSDNFEDILNGQRALNIYNGFSARKAVEPLCVSCSFKHKFSIHDN